MRQLVQVKRIQRIRCDTCDKAVYDTELKINNPHINFGGMSPMVWQQPGDRDGDLMKRYPETATSYLGSKDFCGAECMGVFLMKMVDNAKNQEMLFKMDELKR